ncbi:MAG: 4a-hydroxytetrahydrobiopterin dehydratase [Anaerolineales bacterium]|nr:4a-hydroxytetrahydrobiopterin dehydratase [Anaerolineales bacterium]
MLAHQICTACRKDSPRVTPAEIEDLKPQIPEWTLAEYDGVPRLERTYKFANFAEAIAFTNKVAALAEAEGHHPAILTEWAKVGVSWWTHKIRGLHRNDFIMAARTDEIYRPPQAAA